MLLLLLLLHAPSSQPDAAKGKLTHDTRCGVWPLHRQLRLRAKGPRSRCGAV
jgi:hypothetical protein